MLRVDPALEMMQVKRLKALRDKRDDRQVQKALRELRQVAQGDGNLVEPVLEAVEAYATVGEISDELRKVWGEYHDSR